MHQLAHGRGIDLLGRRDQDHVVLLQRHHGVHLVVPVSVQPRQLVYEHDVHIALLTNTSKHLLECNALRHLGARAPRLNVLVDNLEALLLGLLLAREPLGRQ
nr:hypothetical protein [Microbacterium sp. RURRCA19A]